MAKGFKIADGYVEVHADPDRDSARLAAEGLTRDVNGRLRDQQGRYVAEGDRAGRNYQVGFIRGFTSKLSKMFEPLGHEIPLVGAVGKMLGAQLATSMKYALYAGLAEIGTELVNALMPAVGALALLPAALGPAVLSLGALKIGMSGVGDALKAGLAGDTGKFAEAIAKMAPAAQETMKAIVGLKPQLDGLKKTVQQALFAGLAQDVKDLGGIYLPMFRTELAATATGFNEMFGAIAQLARTPAFINQSTTAWHNSMLAVQGLTGAIPGLFQGLSQVAAVGSAFLPGLTSGLATAGDRFAGFIAQVSASGQLQQFITTGLAALGQLFQVLGQAGSIVVSVLNAANIAGGDLQTTVGSLLGGIATFLKTAEGMKALQDLFRALAQIGGALSAGIVALLPAVGGVVSSLAPLLAQIVTTIAPALSAALTALAPLFGLFDFVGPLAQVIAALLPTVSQLAVILGSVLANALSAIMPALLSLAQTLTSALAPVLPVLASLFAALAPVLGQIAMSLASLLAPVLQVVSALLVSLGPVISDLATTIGQILVQAMAQLLPLFVALAPPLIAWIQQYMPQLLPLIDQLGHLMLVLIPQMKPLVDLFIALIPAIVATSHGGILLVQALTAIVGALASFFGWLDGMPARMEGFKQAMLSFVAAVWSRIVGVFSAIGSVIGTAASAIGSAFHSAVGAVGTAIDAVIGFVVALPGRIWAGLQALPGIVIGLAKAAFDGFFFAIGYSIGASIRVVQAIPGAVAAAFHAVVAAVENAWHASVNAVTNMWSTIKAWFSSGVAAVAGFLNALPGRVSAIFNSAMNAARNAVSSGINAISGFMSALPGRVSAFFGSAMNSARSLVSSGINAVVSFFQGLPGRAAGALRGLGSALGGAVSSAGSALYSAGQNLLNGLINGIKSMVGAAVGAVKRAVGDVIAGAKSALGIKSPSLVFQQIGGQTVAGYIQGIQQNKDEAHAAVIGALAPPGLTAPAIGRGPAGPAAGQYGPYTIEVGGAALARFVIDAVTGAPKILASTVREGNRQLGYLGAA